MNTFSFDRFRKVLVYDFKNVISSYGVAMSLMMLMPLAMWISGLVLNNPLDINANASPEFRLSYISVLMVAAAVFAPSRVYKSCNLPSKGNYFALLPASLGEKFLSMFLYCFILIPVAVFLGGAIVDSLLTLLPIGYFAEPLWKIDVSMPDCVIAPFWWCVFAVVCLFSNIAIFFFTNTIFKKNKVFKTILWLMLISFVLSLVGFSWVIDWLMSMENMRDIDMDGETAFKITFWTGFAICAIFFGLLTFFTHRRLKKMQY